MNSEDETFKILLVLAEDLETAATHVKRKIAELKGVEETVAVKEETFTCLKFEPQQGAKIGEYEVAYKANNIEDKWASAYNVLRNSNATINSRYHGEGYQFSYWLYGENKIYRQRTKHEQA